MPDVRPSEPLRRIVDANLRYYEGLGRLTVDYVRALAGLWNEVRGAAAAPPVASAPASSAPRTYAAPAAPPREASAPDRPAAPALVLEGESGAVTGGLFRVTNDLRRSVSAPVVVSPFRDGAGGEVRVAARVEPGLVTLEPGENTIVQVHVTIPGEAEPGATYHAEVTVPGLAEGGIPLVLRRLPDSPAGVFTVDVAGARSDDDASSVDPPAPAGTGATDVPDPTASAASDAAPATENADPATASAGVRRRRPPRLGA